MSRRLPPARILPPDAVAELQKAARTRILKADPLARVKAINHAIEQIKYRHPEFFIQKEQQP
ncbi:MAG: hypothetical protein GXY45_10575 [Ramlibacter sp.]|nr:hypothetical protein [Ramlibacter sp.]